MLIVIWLNYWGTVKSSPNNLLRWYFFWVIVKVVLGNPNTSIKRCLSAEDTLTKSTLFYSIWCPQVASSPTRPRGLYQIHPRGMCDWLLRCTHKTSHLLWLDLDNSGHITLRNLISSFSPYACQPKSCRLEARGGARRRARPWPSHPLPEPAPGTHQSNNLGVDACTSVQWTVSRCYMTFAATLFFVKNMSFISSQTAA